MCTKLPLGHKESIIGAKLNRCLSCMETHRGLSDLTAGLWFTLCWDKYSHAAEQNCPRAQRRPQCTDSVCVCAFIHWCTCLSHRTFACVTFVMFKCLLMRLVEGNPTAVMHAQWHTYTLNEIVHIEPVKQGYSFFFFSDEPRYSSPWSDELMWFIWTYSRFQKQLLKSLLLSTYSPVVTYWLHGRTSWETHRHNGFPSRCLDFYFFFLWWSMNVLLLSTIWRTCGENHTKEEQLIDTARLKVTNDEEKAKRGTQKGYKSM